MKPIFLSISLLLFTGTALACTNNPLFDICKQTATIAASQCDSDAAAAPKCLCAAQKQLLACYSECTDDPTVSALMSEQKKNVQSVCDQPGAESEIKMRKKNQDVDTVGTPIRITEPFKPKPKPQAVNDGGDGVIRAASELPGQSNSLHEQGEEEKTAKKDPSNGPGKETDNTEKPSSANINSNQANKHVPMKESGGVISPVSTHPLLLLVIVALSGGLISNSVF
ncbi:hypothetical protein [Absidia glauca]|uniref:Extracellular membrane protein CFEM domain-containing protein n=1 Tax=Absidia glauca TaxID=4829 RepID=A0A163JAI5_ABSGL|nr:hypothetical protein [Absidia glauca]